MCISEHAVTDLLYVSHSLYFVHHAKNPVLWKRKGMWEKNINEWQCYSARNAAGQHASMTHALGRTSKRATRRSNCIV